MLGLGAVAELPVSGLPDAVSGSVVLLINRRRIERYGIAAFEPVFWFSW